MSDLEACGIDHLDGLYACARGLSGDRERAEELVLDAYERVFAHDRGSGVPGGRAGLRLMLHQAVTDAWLSVTDGGLSVGDAWLSVGRGRKTCSGAPAGCPLDAPAPARLCSLHLIAAGFSREEAARITRRSPSVLGHRGGRTS
ncbi:hypothetical protein [Streptomyces sp. NPDC001851]|uniref:hypothetical protein n=1 Tax=Streptomyces sp. NPDC001851 TaxID=3154529 RepID=UPI0033290832